MKRSIAIILSCLFLLLCVLSPCLSVKASFQSFTTDYSSILSVSQMEGVLSGLTAGELSTLYTSLGGLAYSYLQSVNVDIKAQSQNSLLPDLGKQVLSFIFHPLDSIASYAYGYVYDSLTSNSKYFLSTLFNKVDNSSIDETNYTSIIYEWKSVSSVMSDVFNSFSRFSSWSLDSHFFVSPSLTRFSDFYNLPFSSFSLSGYEDVPSAQSDYDDYHSNFPTLFINPVYSSSSYVSSFPTSYFTVFLPYPYQSFSGNFDSIIFISNYSSSDNTTYSFTDSNGDIALSYNPSQYYPFLLFDSVSDSLYRLPMNTQNIRFSYDQTYYNDPPYNLRYVDAYQINNRNFPSHSYSFGNFATFDFNSFVSFILGFSSILPTGFSSLPIFSNIYAYQLGLSSSIVSLDSMSPISTEPITIDTNDAYQGSLQIPVDNAPGAVANLDIQSVIDSINDNSLVNNIDRLGSIISDGVVGSIPQVSIDAWNPDKVTEHATSTDISVGLDGLSAIEGTYVDNVAPVFETYPIVPFLQPIFDALGSNVISIIAVCIFIVVLFGFLNKLLF